MSEPGRSRVAAALTGKFVVFQLILLEDKQKKRGRVQVQGGIRTHLGVLEGFLWATRTIRVFDLGVLIPQPSRSRYPSSQSDD